LDARVRELMGVRARRVVDRGNHIEQRRVASGNARDDAQTRAHDRGVDRDREIVHTEALPEPEHVDGDDDDALALGELRREPTDRVRDDHAAMLAVAGHTRDCVAKAEPIARSVTHASELAKEPNVSPAP